MSGNLGRLPDEAVERALHSDNPAQWARGYRAGRRAHNRDSDAYLRRLTRPQDAPRIAGYLHGLATARALTAWGQAEMRRFESRPEKRGYTPSYLREAA